MQVCCFKPEHTLYSKYRENFPFSNLQQKHMLFSISRSDMQIFLNGFAIIFTLMKYPLKEICCPFNLKRIEANIQHYIYLEIAIRLKISSDIHHLYFYIMFIALKKKSQIFFSSFRSLEIFIKVFLISDFFPSCIFIDVTFLIMHAY